MQKNNDRMFTGLILAVIALLTVGCSSGDNIVEENTGLHYYVDAVNGSDSNSGLGESSAWQTLQRIELESITEPVTVHLKRGQQWYGTLEVPVSDFTLSDYGSGSLPLLYGHQALGSWTDNGSGLFFADASLSADEALGNLRENGEMMTFLPWDTDTATTFASATDGSYSLDYNLDRLYIKTSLDPSTTEYLASYRIWAVHSENQSNIHIENIQIEGYSLHGIQFDHCDTCGADNVTIEHIGGAVIATSPALLYAGNGVEFANASNDGYLTNSTIQSVFDSCYTVQTYSSQQAATNFILSSSELSGCGFAGIELSVLDNSSTVNSSIDGIQIRNVSISDSGKGWSGRRYGNEGNGLRIKADDGAGSINDIYAEQLDITNAAGSGVYIAGDSSDIQLHRTSSHANDEYGLLIADASATALDVTLTSSLIYNNGSYGINLNAPAAAASRIYHNTLVNNGSIQLAVFNSPTLVDIRNNLFFSGVTDLYLASAGNINSDYNCYQNHSNMMGISSDAYNDLASVTSDTGLETNSISDGASSLVDAANANFHLTSSSGCIGAGDASLNVGTDYDGQVWEGSIDMGALKFTQ